jgi:hypothetical protein
VTGDVDFNPWRTLLTRRSKMQGFIIFEDYGHRFGKFFEKMTTWLKEGKIKNMKKLTVLMVSGLIQPDSKPFRRVRLRVHLVFVEAEAWRAKDVKTQAGAGTPE